MGEAILARSSSSKTPLTVETGSEEYCGESSYTIGVGAARVIQVTAELYDEQHETSAGTGSLVIVDGEVVVNSYMGTPTLTDGDLRVIPPYSDYLIDSIWWMLVF